MMGNKTLSEMRRDLKRALASKGEDPIARLEKSIAKAKHRGERTEVLESLKRVLQGDEPKRPRKRATAAKK